MAHHILAARQTVVMPINPHHISWIRPQYRHSPVHSHYTLASGSPRHRPRHRLREALEEGQTDDTTIVRPAPVSACSTTRTRSCDSVSFLSCYARRLKAASTDALSSYEQCDPPILSSDLHPSTARFRSLLSRDGTTTLKRAIVRGANAETTRPLRPTRAVVGCQKVFGAGQWHRHAYWYAGIVSLCEEGRMGVRRLCVDAHARLVPLSFPNCCSRDSDSHALMIRRYATSLANCIHDTHGLNPLNIYPQLRQIVQRLARNQERGDVSQQNEGPSRTSLRRTANSQTRLIYGVASFIRKAVAVGTMCRLRT